MSSTTCNDTLQRSIALGLLALACTACSTTATTPAVTDVGGRQLEQLDRGLVAIATQGGNFVSWRALGLEDGATTFNLYRDGKRINAQPLAATNFVDLGAAASAAYSVRAVRGSAEAADSAKPAATWTQPWLTIPLRKPADGVTPDGVAYSYVVNDGSAADLDGDGRYELLVKWYPTNAKDNSHSGYTGATYIDAYRLDGSFMWRIDLGRNIRAGAHYTQFMAYDLDGDGRAEIACKTADGTVDGQGKTLG
ncbi:MAG: rhamnogalacturonan lyase, partial [Lysobacteraceae bacterium]